MSYVDVVEIISLLCNSLDRNLARDSTVGWSNKTVGARSMLKRAAIALVNSTAKRESTPADISGVLVSTSAPVTSCATSRITTRTSCTSYCDTFVCDATGDAVAAQTCSLLRRGRSGTWISL